MTALTASRLLAVWERGLNRPLLWKTFELLAAAFPELDSRSAAALSIGERDARLLTLREYLFGSTLLNLATCPQCGKSVEWEVNASRIRMRNISEVSGEKDRDFSLQAGEYRVCFRLPTSIDIDAVLAAASPSGTGGRRLVERCILSVTQKGETQNPDLSPDQLPLWVLDRVSRRMEAEDPQADIRMLLDCPYCNHAWKVCFDIVRYLWEEIHRWALQMMQTIHLLAKTYHWSEEHILDMSPRRRHMYLQMINGS